ncbi:type II/IV secretion system protein [Candidatus Woesebacteria bacterium]|nr:type II/IV secretion system protein [Candidatus Woesebacteria bacterium]
MQLNDETLKKIVVGSGFVSEEDFDKAKKSAEELDKNVRDVLVFRGHISEEALSKLISKHLNIKYADIGRQSIPEEILSLIPEKIAKTYRMVPIAVKDNKLMLAMSDPGDFEALEFAKRQTGMSVEPLYASNDDVRRAIGQYKKGIKEEFSKVILENLKQAKVDDDLAKSAEKLPIINILDSILEYATSERASDVHIETLEEEVVIRFRIDGVLRDIIKLPKGIETALVARIKILSNLKIDEHRVPQDGRYKFNIDDNVIALRISIIPGFYGENVVMRILKESARPLSLEELGLSGDGLEIIKRNITRPHGMILVTGPTGSGKTTTLYSILNILNTIEVKIATIEDPIEYGINRVSQIQVNNKTGLDFAAGLRALLRHDPDIIMVGEIRDQETAEISVHAALTGHLVLSTLHTNTAAGAIPRFIDMGVEGFLLASTVNVILAQRLVRKICNACITTYKPDKALVKQFESKLGITLTGQKFYKGKGCEQCGGKGFMGRIGIYEVLEVTETIRELITDKTNSEDIQKAAMKEGMITMLRDGLDKVASGQTTIDEVIRVIREE